MFFNSPLNKKNSQIVAGATALATRILKKSGRIGRTPEGGDARLALRWPGGLVSGARWI